jgi:hypothetical protein
MKISRTVWLIAFWCAIMLALVAIANAHDPRYPVDDKMMAWFHTLASGKGSCCADADGNVIADVDWESRDGHYRVHIDGNWIEVPDSAVITVPNLYGRAMVWPMYSWVNPSIVDSTSIRCFMPGPSS